MVLRRAAIIALLCSAPWTALAETGAEGWLRYSPLTGPAASRQSRTLPHTIVQTSASPVGKSAAAELSRGLHGMLAIDPRLASTLPEDDAFVLGTSADLHRMLPQWNPPATLAPEAFTVSRMSVHGHTFWIVAGGEARGTLYGVFHLEPPTQRNPHPSITSRSHHEDHRRPPHPLLAGSQLRHPQD